MPIEVQGKDIEQITELDVLQDMRNTAFNALDGLRSKRSEQGDKWEDNQRSTWEETNKDYDALKKRMDFLADSEQINKRFDELKQEQEREDNDHRDINKPTTGNKVTDETRAVAVQAWACGQMGQMLNERQIQACRATGINPSGALDFNLLQTRDFRGVQEEYKPTQKRGGLGNREDLFEQRALSADTNTAGAHTIVPVDLIRSLEIAMLQFNGVRQVADVIRTSGAAQMKWPTANDSGNKGRRIAESTTSNTTPDPVFGDVLWDAYKYTSDAVLVPQELLEDSVFDLASVLGEMLGERIGRIEAEEQTTGTGSSQPNGIATAAAAGITAASATAITLGELIQLEHSVDPAYRAGAGYMMNDATALLVRLLFDADGRPLWQPSLTAGKPDNLNARPVTINQEMPAATTGLRSVLFGQFSKYKIRDVSAMRFYRLQERYRVEADQDGFVAFKRSDGNLLAAGGAANSPVKALTMA